MNFHQSQPSSAFLARRKGLRRQDGAKGYTVSHRDQRGLLYFLIFLVGGSLFQYLTKPWHNAIFPTPYLMIYGIGTVLCALEGYFWGLAASMAWYLAVTLYWFWVPDEGGRILNAWQFVRFVLQIVVPLWISRYAERRRVAERRVAELLRVLATAVPHRLNNLLMVVIGQCAVVRADVDECPDLYRKLSEAMESAEEAARMVRSMRSHAAQGLLEPELLRVAELIQEIEPVSPGHAELAGAKPNHA